MLAHGLLEFQQRVPAMPRELDVREHQDVEPDLLALEERDPAANDSKLLQAAHAAPAGRSGQPQLVRDFSGGQIAMILQHIQNAQIPPVQLGLHRSSRCLGV